MKYDGWLLPVLLLAMLPARAQQDSVRVAETLVADSVATMAPDSLAAEGVVVRADGKQAAEDAWNALFAAYEKEYPELAARWKAATRPLRCAQGLRGCWQF